MITADPQRRVTTLAAITDILARDAAPDDRDLLLVLRSRRVRGDAGFDCASPHARGAGRAYPGVFPLRRAHDAAGLSALQGPARSARGGAQSDEAEELALRRGRWRAARGDDRRDAHARRAVHLREPEELLPEGRAARLLGDPSHLHGAAPVGALRADRRPRGRRLARAVLPVPDRADRSARTAAAHRASDLFGAEDGVPRRRGLQGDGAHGPRDRAAPAQPPRPSGRRRVREVVPRLAAGRQLRPDRHAALHARSRRRAPAARKTARSASSPTRRCFRSSSPG